MLKKANSQTFKVSVLSSVISLFINANTYAQDTSTVENTEDSLEVITVTARHVKEDINDLPMTVNILDSQVLKQKRLESLEDVFLAVPGVEISSAGDSSNANVRIRGVGAINKTNRDDSSVVIYVDGVPQPIGFSTLGTLDVESIEVLKGPQGTLFGRNSDAGAIKINTSKATFDTEAYFRAELGEDNLMRFQGAYNTAISDTVAMRIAVGYQEQDHHITNPNDSKPITEPSDLNIRAKLHWDIDDDMSLDFTSSHQRLRNTPFIYSLHPHEDKPVMDAPPGLLDDDKNIDQFTLNFNAKLSFAEFTWISGYSDSEDTSTGILYEGRINNSTFGFIPANYGPLNTKFEREFFNQEFRLNSLPDSDFFWVTGIHYYEDSSSSASFGYEDADFFPRVALNSDINEREFETKSKAIYGELTYPITEKLGLTAGVRHTWDKKEFDIRWAPNEFFPNPPFAYIELDQNLEDDYSTGRIGLNYRITEQYSVYSIFSTGHKSGGFANSGANILVGKLDNPFAASKLKSLEIGFKSTFANGDIRLNGAAFFNDVKDDHIFTFNFFTQETAPENLDTESNGAELELHWQVSESINLQAGLNYTDAKVIGVPENSFSNVPEGSRVPNSANWSASIGLNFYQEVNISGKDLNLNTHLNYNYMGDRAADPANTLMFGEYHKVNLRTGLGSGDWEVYLWGDNLLDERIYTLGMVFNAPASSVARGRQLGLGIEVSY